MPVPGPSRPITLFCRRGTAAHLDALRVGQAGKRHGQRGEIVDDQQRIEAERAPRGFDRKAPVVIRHRNVVAVHRIGDRHGRVG